MKGRVKHASSVFLTSALVLMTGVIASAACTFQSISFDRQLDGQNAFDSEPLIELEARLSQVSHRVERELHGTQTLTKATDDTAIGGVAFLIERMLLSCASPGNSCGAALEEFATACQVATRAQLGSSYPTDKPTASATAIAATDGLVSAFEVALWNEADQSVINTLSRELARALQSTSGLKAYHVESRSRSVQRSGIAIVDDTTAEALWYSVRAVRALTQ